MELVEVEKSLQTLRRESELTADKLSSFSFILNYTKSNGTVYKDLVSSLESVISDDVTIDGLTVKPSTTYVREVARDFSKVMVESILVSINETITGRMVLVEKLLKELDSNYKKLNKKSIFSKKVIELDVKNQLECSLLDDYDYPLPQLLKKRKGLVVSLLGDIKRVTKNLDLIENDESPKDIQLKGKYDFLLYSESDLEEHEKLLEAEANVNDGYYRLINTQCMDINPYIETIEVPTLNLVKGIESDLIDTVVNDLKALIKHYGRVREETRNYSLDSALLLKDQYGLLENLTLLLSSVIFLKVKITNDYLELINKE